MRLFVHDIDMKAFGEPTIEHFATHDPNKAGFSMVQLIETSNICAHFVNELNEVYLDVFSCKSFDPEIVVNLVKQFFKTEKVDFQFITRKAPA